MDHQNINKGAEIELPATINATQPVQQLPLPPFLRASLQEPNLTGGTSSTTASNALSSSRPKPKQPTEEQQSRRCPCPLLDCAWTFDHQSAVLRPVETAHRGPKSQPTLDQRGRKYSCPVPDCAWTFDYPAWVLTHVKQRHVDNPDAKKYVEAEEAIYAQQRVEKERKKVEREEAAASKQAEKEQRKLEEAEATPEDAEAKLKSVQAIRERLEALGRLTCRVGRCLKDFKSEHGRKRHEKICKGEGKWKGPHKSQPALSI